MKRIWASLPFAFLLFLVTVAPFPTRALPMPQATAGYTLIATVAFGTNTFIDTTPGAGQVAKYEVLSVNSEGDSIPSNIVTATTPTTSVAHSNTLTWVPPTGGGTPVSYVVYKLITGIGVTVPNPPGALAVVAK